MEIVDGKRERMQAMARRVMVMGRYTLEETRYMTEEELELALSEGPKPTRRWQRVWKK